MQPLPKDYNFAEIERRWQQKWEEMNIYRFDWNDTNRKPYTIDTPPPYPSGELHMGNVLNWTYFDIVARYTLSKNIQIPSSKCKLERLKKRKRRHGKNAASHRSE